MGLINEFKQFIIKGNAIDMAVGIVVGSAFTLVVKSLVDDVMMPPLGYVIGGIDFSSLSWPLADAIAAGSKHPITGAEVTKDIPAVVIGFGKFINTIIALTIQGFAVFLVVKAINALKRKQAEAPATPAEPPADVKLLTEIRDLLKRNA